MVGPFGGRASASGTAPSVTKCGRRQLRSALAFPIGDVIKSTGVGLLQVQRDRLDHLLAGTRGREDVIAAIDMGHREHARSLELLDGLAGERPQVLLPELGCGEYDKEFDAALGNPAQIDGQGNGIAAVDAELAEQ